MKRELKIEERLIVAADFMPQDSEGICGVRNKILRLARDIEGTGVYIKINSALRALGYTIIDDLHTLGLKVFADLKINDIPNTVATDATLLAEFEPEIVTIMCSCGVDSMRAFKESIRKAQGTPGPLFSTSIFGVTVLTSLDREKCKETLFVDFDTAVTRYIELAKRANIDGLILPPHQTHTVRKLGWIKEIATPAIRPRWSDVWDDDQAAINIATARGAIANGADRIVVGRPITEAYKNPKGLPQTPKKAIEATLLEIQEGLSHRDSL